MKILATVFSLGSLACEFQMVYILLSVGGSTLTFYSPELELLRENHFNKSVMLPHILVCYLEFPLTQLCREWTLLFLLLTPET